MSSGVWGLTFTIMVKQPLEERRKLRSKNGGKDLCSIPPRKLDKTLQLAKKLMPGMMREDHFHFKMHIKPSHSKALHVQRTSLPTAPSSLHLYFIWCPSRGGDLAEPRRGKAQEPQHRAFAFSQANLELGPGGCSPLPSCASASSLLFNPKLKRILEDHIAGENLRCCKSMGGLGLLTPAGPSSKPCQCCSCWPTRMSGHQHRTWRISIVEIHATRTLQMQK